MSAYCLFLGIGIMNIKVSRYKTKAGFTLIELLVVISIIAVLMAILMPALAKVKEQAKAVVCSTRQKDIGMALNLYSQDWSQKLPIAGIRDYTSATPEKEFRLPYKLKPYYDQKGTTSNEVFSYQMYRCPTQKLNINSAAYGSYGYNTFYFNGLKSRGVEKYTERAIYDIKTDTARLPLLGCLSQEMNPEIAGQVGGQEMYYSGPHPNVLKYGYLGGKVTVMTRDKLNYFGPAPNHGRNCNMLMADFHVEAVNVCVEGQYPWTEPRGAEFHPSRAGGSRNQRMQTK